MQAEVARLEQLLKDERDNRSETGRRLRQLQADAAQAQSKLQQMLIEKEAELDGERYSIHSNI